VAGDRGSLHSYIYNSKSNAILDYVGFANFSIIPRSSVYRTMSESEYEKVKWIGNPGDLVTNNYREFIFYYEVVDSDKNVCSRTQLFV